MFVIKCFTLFSNNRIFFRIFYLLTITKIHKNLKVQPMTVDIIHKNYKKIQLITVDTIQYKNQSMSVDIIHGNKIHVIYC